MKVMCGRYRRVPWDGAWRYAILVMYSVTLLGLCSAQVPRPLEYHVEEENPSDTFVADLLQDSGLKFQYKEHPDILDQITLEFSSQPGEHWHYFYIEASTGILRTSQPIDREVLCPSARTCPVHMNVITQPSQFFRIIKVTVYIDDINDNEPTFPQRNLFLDISESALAGAAFVIPAAEDLDSGDYGIQKYELQPPSKYFKLRVGNSSEGSGDVHLVLQERLDREQRQLYVMNIIAYDGGTVALSGFIEVHITVQDANDNNPRFYNYTYEVEILETIAKGTTIIRLQASDPDAGLNGELEYSLSEHTEQTVQDLFDIDPHNGRVFTLAALDYEKAKQYQLTVVAKDKGENSLPAYAKLMIKVLDVNDHTPEITVNTLTEDGDARILEAAPIGTFVAHVSVLDLDEGDNGAFHCSIESDKFELQQLYETVFKIVTTVLFDREVQEVYHVNLMCKDSGSPSLISTRHIKVTVQDINDNAPSFSQQEYNASIAENNFIGAAVAMVNASDRDSGNNADLLYSLQGDQGTLSIDPVTGEIKALIQFDYEQENLYQVTVIVTDQGEKPMSATALLRVSVIDMNDQPPVFIQDSYLFQVKENLPVKTKVGRVEAVFIESSLYTDVTYLIETRSLGVSDRFSVDPNSGEISTLQELDREEAETYKLKVIALNKDNPGLKTHVDLTINVVDTNDNFPVIEFPTVENNTLNISNLVPVKTVIGQVRAYDLDLGENGHVTYKFTNSSLKLFEIDGETGHILVAGSIKHIVHKVFAINLSISDRGRPRLGLESASPTLYITVDSSIAYVTVSPPGGWLSKQNLILICVLVPLFVLVCMVLTILLVRRRKVKDENARRYNCRLEAQKKRQASLQRGSSSSLEKPPKYRISGMDIGESSTDDFTDPNSSGGSKDTERIVKSKSQWNGGGKLRGCSNHAPGMGEQGRSDPEGNPRHPDHPTNFNNTLDKIETEVQKIISMQEREETSDDDSMTDSGRGPSEEGEHNTTRGSPAGSSRRDESSFSQESSPDSRGIQPQVVPSGGTAGRHYRHVQPVCDRTPRTPGGLRAQRDCTSLGQTLHVSPGGLSVKNDTTNFHQKQHSTVSSPPDRTVQYTSKCDTPRPLHGYHGNKSKHRHSDNCQSYDTHDFGDSGPSCSRGGAPPRRQVSDSGPAMRWACSNGFHGNRDRGLNDNFHNVSHKNQRHKDVIYPCRKDPGHESAWNSNQNHPGIHGNLHHPGDYTLNEQCEGCHGSDLRTPRSNYVDSYSPGCSRYKGAYCVTGTPVRQCIHDVVNRYLPDRSTCREEESGADLSDGDTTTSGSYVVDPTEYEVEPQDPVQGDLFRDLYI